MCPLALGTGVSWGHPGAIRTICHPWMLRSSGGSCSPASAKRNHHAANQTSPAAEQPQEPYGISEALIDLNETQSSPAGWTVSLGEPGEGPVLGCLGHAGCQPGC